MQLIYHCKFTKINEQKRRDFCMVNIPTYFQFRGCCEILTHTSVQTYLHKTDIYLLRPRIELGTAGS